MNELVKKLALASCLACVLASSRTANARGCTEQSDVVGEEVCTRYGGGWSNEGKFPVVFRFGARYVDFSTDGATFDENIGKQARPAGYRPYSYPGEALGVRRLGALGFDGGLTIFVFDQLYTGIDGGLAFGSASTARFTTSTGVNLSSADGVDVTFFHGGTPVGYRIPLGHASLRLETLFGFEAVSVSHHVDAKDLPSSGGATAWRALVEPRVAADIWFTQHVSFGLYAGVNVVDHGGGGDGGRALGLSLAWHYRAFDGR